MSETLTTECVSRDQLQNGEDWWINNRPGPAALKTVSKSWDAATISTRPTQGEGDAFSSWRIQGWFWQSALAFTQHCEWAEWEIDLVREALRQLWALCIAFSHNTLKPLERERKNRNTASGDKIHLLEIVTCKKKRRKKGFGSGQSTNHVLKKNHCSSFICYKWQVGHVGEDKAQHMANQAARQNSFPPGIQGRA